MKFGAKLPAFQEASDSERDFDREWNFAGSQQNDPIDAYLERESQQVISLPQSQAMTPDDRQLSLGMLEAHLALQGNKQSDQKSHAADSLSQLKRQIDFNADLQDLNSAAISNAGSESDH